MVKAMRPFSVLSHSLKFLRTWALNALVGSAGFLVTFKKVAFKVKFSLRHIGRENYDDILAIKLLTIND